jgi:putative ABC transport system permease protein
MYKNYVKIALRHLRKNKLFSVINIVGLSIGLACCILILLFISDEFSFDRFHLKKDHIYQLTCKRTEPDGTASSFGIAALVQGPSFKQNIPEIQDFVRVDPRDLVVKRGNDLFNETATWVDPAFFRVFTFPILYGDPINALSDLHGLVLSEDAAVKYFGKTAVIGKTLMLDMGGRFEPFTVNAVAKAAPTNSSIRFTMLLNFEYFEKLNPDNGWMWVSFPTYLLLSANADPVDLARKMDQVYATRAKEEIGLNHLAGYGNKFTWGARPMTAMHLDRTYEGTPYASNPIYAYVLAGIAFFILLIACINFVNLTVALSLQRSKEIGIRKVMGSRRWQLIIQFLSESLVVCLAAFLLALAIAGLLLPLFNSVAAKQLSMAYLFYWKLVAAFITLFFITGITAGFYPALVLSGFNPSDALAGKAGSRGKNYLARSLVVVQFALATFLVVATLFIYGQFNLMTHADLGYNDHGLIRFTVGPGVRNKAVMDRYKSAFGQLPGVLSAGYCNIGRFGGKTQAGNKEFNATYVHTDEGYLPAMGVQLVAGRNFSKDFPADSISSVLINQALAGKAGWRDAIGKTIDYMDLPAWGARKMTVIGVVKDYHNESLKEKIQPMVFTEESALPLGQMILRIKPAHTATILLSLEKTWQQLDSDHPFLYEFVSESNQRAYQNENKWKQLITFGAIVTILISATGLFGLALLAAQRRKKEIGIRKVMGASVTELATLISKEFALLVLLSFLFAIPLGWLAMHQWLQNFAYRVPLSWWRFLLAGTISLTIAMLTVTYQAIKAARANPIGSLRNE